MTHPLTRPKQSIVALVTLLAVTLVVAGVGCKSLTTIPANLATFTDSGVVYAINGAPPGAPTALHVFSGTLLSADATFTFDIAFDIDSAGNAVYLPQRAVASGLATTHAVGLQTSTLTFDDVGSAPKTGYRADTALVARPNQVILVQSQDPNACGVSVTGTFIYAKVVVTAIDATAKQLTLRYTIDPNCGFQSFASGIPTQ